MDATPINHCLDTGGAPVLRKLTHKHDSTAEPIDLKIQLARVAEGLADGVVPLARGHDQEKTAAAGAEQFSTLRAGFAGRFIPSIDPRVTDAESKGALQFPAVV